MIEKCSPVEMRKNLEVVEQFKRAGIDFVAIPVRDSARKDEMIALGKKILEEMAVYAESVINQEESINASE